MVGLSFMFLLVIRADFFLRLHVAGVEDDKLDIFTAKGMVQGSYLQEVHQLLRDIARQIVVSRREVYRNPCPF